MSYDQGVSWAVEWLDPVSSTPKLDAELLLGHVVERSRASVLARGAEPLSETELHTFTGLVERRASGEPVAYLRSQVDWWDFTVKVSPDVLIPRPDTEVVVERALAAIAGSEPASVADIGTGSGIIAIAIARERTNVSATAVDISETALRVAEANVRRLRLADRVNLVLGNLLEPLDSEPNLIVANLPYLSFDIMNTLAPSVRAEPARALFGGPDGLDLYRELFAQYRARGWRCPLICEIDPRQTDLMSKAILTTLSGAVVSVWPDLAGRDRAVEIRP